MKLLSLLVLTLVAVGACEPLHAAHPQAGTPSAPPAAMNRSGEGVRTYGAFRQWMHRGDFSSQITLGAVPDADDLFGLGAVANLDGEITLLHGQRLVSLGSAPRQRMDAAQTSNIGAALLVTARVPAWREVPVPHDVKPEDVEAFVASAARKAGLSDTASFAFLIKGRLGPYKAHVLQGANAGFKGHGSGVPMARQMEERMPSGIGTVVAFFAAPHDVGVITHPGERIHAHLVAADASRTSHLDSFGIGAGAVLMLPASGATPAAPDRLATVAKLGAEVMPFQLAATTHIFSKTDDGGVQRVVVKQMADAAQIERIRQHLKAMQSRFSAGDYAWPSRIHGSDMPGLSDLQKAGQAGQGGQMSIEYRDVPGGAELAYRCSDPKLVSALHRWFDAQVSDHGPDAQAGEMGHHHPHAH